MKKLPAFLNTPARVVIAVGLIILLGELSIMLLIESINPTAPEDTALEKIAFEFIDPILLIAIVSPALYILILQPMRRQQAELERQVDELRRFQKMAVGRELRMKELVEKIDTLCIPLSAEAQLTTSSPEKPRDEAAQPASTSAMEAEQRSALLFMLEDLEAGRRKIEQAHREWMAALDVVDDPIFLHDKEFRILRCNKAYQQCAGIPFHEIIGQPYYEIFPKIGAPLPCCLRAMEKAEEEEEEEVAVGEATYRSRAFSIHDEQGAYLCSVHTFEDITARKRGEEGLKRSEARFRSYIELTGQLAWNADAEGKAVEDIPEWRAFTGQSEAQVKGHGWSEAIHPDDRAQVMQIWLEAVGRKGKYEAEIRVRRHDGVYRDFLDRGVPLFDESGQIREWVGTAIDITARKQAEEELRLRAQLLDRTADSIFVADFDGNFVYLNEAAWKSRGYTRDELMAMNLHALDVPEYEKLIEARIRELMENGESTFESTHRRKDGSIMPIEVSTRIIEVGGRKLILAAVRDITERKQAEQALKKNEALLNEMGRLAKVGGWEFNVETRDMTWTEEVYRIHELDTTYKPTVDKGIEFYAPASRPIIARVVQRAIEYGEPYDVELEFITAKGNHRWVHANGNAYREHGKTITVFGTFQDITDRKQAEIALGHANRALAALSLVNRSLVRATNEAELFQATCDAIVQQRGYRLAWVGYALHNESKSIKIMARAGHDEGYLDGMQLTWAETERGMGPSGRAIRNGATQVCQNMTNDPSYLPWRDAASKRGYASDIALPLIGESGSVFGILHVYSDEMNAFIPGEIALLEEMAGDLAFGIRSLHTRHERDLTLVKNQEQLVQLVFQNEEKEKRAAELTIANKELQDSLEDTVRAIASIAEMRDPYTAGHQVRVADLATAIAKQMALPEEQIHAIHLAGVVHDLGKIKVPAEILSKPGKITDLEFGLIKIHPQAGYDILQGIDFPWPIAQMVWQHHERLDGSGYPQGLKGNAILLEARILAVADVVEAMSSHRPYRPGLGIEVALAEITKQRGVHYDSQVVDACLALFREQHYSFKS